MNQTEKRLQIVKLAISLTDEECVNQQMYKLMQVNGDEALEEILALLRAKNYAQAQQRIVIYLETPRDTLAQRVPNEAGAPESASQEEPEKETAETFELIADKEAPRTLQSAEDIKAFLQEAPPNLDESDTLSQEAIASFYEIDPDEVLKDAPDIDLSAKPRDDDTPRQEEYAQTPPDSHTNEQTADNAKEDRFERFEAQPYIKEKFATLLERYAPALSETPLPQEAERLLEKMQSAPYDEALIFEGYRALLQKRQNNRNDEATLILIALGCSHAPLGKLLLARELVKGELLETDHAEALDTIRTLAVIECYPEAICDLAQLYEHGLITEKNPAQAQALYEEAAKLGLERAKRHLQRGVKKKRFLGLF